MVAVKCEKVMVRKHGWQLPAHTFQVSFSYFFPLIYVFLQCGFFCFLGVIELLTRVLGGGLWFLCSKFRCELQALVG